jgi:thioesterase-3
MFQYDPNKKYPKETESKVVIRFQDCDPLQHLNNAKYFDYFFNAREDQVPKVYNLEPSEIFIRYKQSWVVFNHQIAYVRAARMGEWVNIISRIIWYDNQNVLVEYVMLDKDKTQLKTLLWSHLRYIDVVQGKSTDHPPVIADYLKAATVEGFDHTEITFNERIKQIKDSLK